jgi:lipoprotein-releasing system ATP-binding protein
MPGEIVGLVGPSGSGKSSLLHAAGLLEHPDGGRISILGADCSDLGERERTRVRLASIGFVYQFHHLLPEFSALDNVALPQMIAGASRGAARARANALLADLGLGERVHHQPGQLSGGEQQRVALARAFINRPKILFADEPTGNLDAETSSSVIDIMLELNRSAGTALVLVTHDADVAGLTERTVRLRNGEMV